MDSLHSFSFYFTDFSGKRHTDLPSCDGSSHVRAEHIPISAVDGVSCKAAWVGQQVFGRASAFPCIALRTEFTVLLRTTEKWLTSEKLCLKMNWDNLVNSSKLHCESAMQSESKLGVLIIFLFFFLQEHHYPRTGILGILGYKNVPDIAGPLANIWYKCCFICRSSESVSVQCYICS